MILNALERKPLPVYGRGLNVRDWLYVQDHCDALWHVFTHGNVGETYVIGGRSERTNLSVVQEICRILAEETGTTLAEFEGLVRFVTDRPGHDLRYAIDPSRIERELSWTPRETFESGLRKTVRWYIESSEWVNGIRTGAYRDWIERNYQHRSEEAS
jgi:dTDP-glucose 4,6-dehydratase